MGRDLLQTPQFLLSHNLSVPTMAPREILLPAASPIPQPKLCAVAGSPRCGGRRTEFDTGWTPISRRNAGVAQIGGGRLGEHVRRSP